MIIIRQNLQETYQNRNHDDSKQCRTALLCAGAHGDDLDLLRRNAGQFAELEAEGELSRGEVRRRVGQRDGSGDGVDKNRVCVRENKTW